VFIIVIDSIYGNNNEKNVIYNYIISKNSTLISIRIDNDYIIVIIIIIVVVMFSSYTNANFMY